VAVGAELLVTLGDGALAFLLAERERRGDQR